MTTPPAAEPPRSRAPAAPPAFFDDHYRRLLAPFHSEADARRETAALREILGLAQDDHVLDLGCGWGRHLVLLARAGHRITGLDLAWDLLRHVPPTAPAAAPPPRVAADMRALPLPTASFDAVLNLATSLGLFLHDHDALTALREVRRVLRPRGRFLIEGMHRDDVVASFATRDAWTLDDDTVVRARRRFDPLRGISHEVLRWTDPDGTPRTKRHSLRLRSATELVALLDAARLPPVHAFGDWDGRPFSHTSPRLILVATGS